MEQWNPDIQQCNIYNVQSPIKNNKDAGKHDPYPGEKSIHRNRPRNDRNNEISKDFKAATTNISRV